MIKKPIFYLQILGFIIISFIHFNFVVYADRGDMRFDRLTTADGLPSDAVFSIVQDQAGLMWFGTFEGLCRYDGYTCTVYKHIIGDETSLTKNSILSLYEDRQGTLWVGTWGNGISQFKRDTETFINYPSRKDDPNSLSDGNISVMYEDSQGRFWVGTQSGGLHKFNREEGTFVRYMHDSQNLHSLSHDEVRDIVEDKTGILWLATREGGLNKFDPETETFTHYQHDEQNRYSLGDNNVYSIHVATDGFMWLKTASGLSKFNSQTETFTNYHPDSNLNSATHIQPLYQDEQGQIWLGTAKGLILFNPTTETFTHYEYNPLDPKSILPTVLDMYKDKAGTVWLTTFKSGVSKFDPLSNRFTQYKPDPNDENSLSHPSVASVFEDKEGLIWIGTGEGMDLFNPEDETFLHYSYKRNNKFSATGPILYQDHTGWYWSGSWGSGLRTFNPATEDVILYKHDENDSTSLSNNRIIHIYEDHQQILWVATWGGGLNRFNRKTETFTPYRHDENDPQTIASDIVTYIYEDSQGTLWIGNNEGGLNKFNRETETFERYLPNENDSHTLGSDYIRAILEDSRGWLWVGTIGGGLNKLDRNTGKFTRYLASDGLPSDSVHGLLEDEQGNLWLSTDKGLARFNPETETVDIYTTDDGLAGNTFSQSAAFWKSRTGKMYFGGDNSGLVVFNPNDISTNNVVPPVIINDFKLFNQAQKAGEADSPLKQWIGNVKDLTLSYEDYIFSFEFSALNYSHSDDNQYAYRLEGFEEDWNYVSSKQRFATYTNIPPGDYVFQVKASNNDGLWNETGIAIHLTITPPWWQTGWFRVLMGVLIVGSLYATYRWRVYNIQAQNRRLEKEVTDRTAQLQERTSQLQEKNQQLQQRSRELKVARDQAEKAKEKAELANRAKSEFLSNMSHELRTPLNGVLGYTQILLRKRNLDTTLKDGLTIIQSSGKHLLTLINDILDLSKIEARKLELQPKIVHLESFLESVAGVIRVGAHEKNLRFRLECSNDLSLAIEADEKRLRQVLINLLGNAVKFTQQGYVSLKVVSFPSCNTTTTKNGDSSSIRLRFEVKDTGVGMSPQDLQKIFLPFEQVGNQQTRAEGTGLGLTITRRLVRLMEGEIHVESIPEQDTTFWFEVNFPITQLKPQSLAKPTTMLTGYRGPRQQVLVVDDKTENRLVLLNMLNHIGFEVTLAENGQEAISKAQKLQPVLILMDLIMPVMNGFEAVKQIRTLPNLENVPIVAVSASIFEMDQTKSRHSGCDAFIPKPVELEILYQVIEKFLPLTWVYGDAPEELVIPVDNPSLNDILVLPPVEILEQIYEMACFGRITRIEDIILEIEDQDNGYAHFATQIKHYVQAFDDEGIVKLIEPHLYTIT